MKKLTFARCAGDEERGGTAACTESVAGCQIALVPDCHDSCGAGEFCGFDAGCKATPAPRA